MLGKPVTFEAFGVPRPGGSKTAFPFRKASGAMGVRVTDSNPRVGAWRDVIAEYARRAMDGKPPMAGALQLIVAFYMPRPKGHLKKDGVTLVKSAPSDHIVKPDATKLLRALEDALTGIVWFDDAQIVSQTVTKLYCKDAMPFEYPRATVTVVQLESREVGK